MQVIRVGDGASQAQAVLAEIQRLRELGVSPWSRIAVLSSTHRDLAQVRALAEQQSIPVRWYAGQNAMPPLHQVREIHRFLRHLAQARGSLMRATDLLQTAASQLEADSRNPWLQFLCRMLEGWRNESSDAELPAQEALEFLYETCAESRRDFTYGDGVALNTVHAAKGTEYDHVLLIGPWPLRPERTRQEEERRAFYVGITRARQTSGGVRPGRCPALPAPDLDRPGDLASRVRRLFEGRAICLAELHHAGSR